MSRLTAFSVCAVLAGATAAPSAPAAPARETEAPSVDHAAVADAIGSTVEQVFERCNGAVVRVESEDELGKVAGTGFFADSAGTIFTLASVVGDGLSITVTHGDDRWPARLLTKDARSGIALIKVDAARTTPFLTKGDCSELKPASPLVAIGFPLDHDVTPGFGLVGGFDRQSQGRFFATTHIRASIPVQRGQGGSPVVNLEGDVVGVLVSGFEDGAGCYVLPMRAAAKVLTDFERFGDVRHGWAGVTVQEMPVAVHGSRMAIDVVDPAGPAAGNFRPGDVLLQVGDIVISEPEDTLDASFFLTAGDTVEVRVARGNEVISIPFTAGQHPLERKDDLQALGPAGLMGPGPAAAP